MNHPYKEFENSRAWKALREGLEDLVANQDLQITTAPEYVIGSLCKALVAAGVIQWAEGHPGASVRGSEGPAG